MKEVIMDITVTKTEELLRLCWQEGLIFTVIDKWGVPISVISIGKDGEIFTMMFDNRIQNVQFANEQIHEMIKILKMLSINKKIKFKKLVIANKLTDKNMIDLVEICGFRLEDNKWILDL